MNLYARQGDLVIEKLSTPITGELVKRDNVVFAGNSSGHRHRIAGSVLVLGGDVNRQGTRFRVGEALQLVHENPDGHRTVELVAGDYEIRPLREQGDGSDRMVED